MPIDLGKILALDYGTKRIGVALSDETKTISIPKPYFLNTEKQKLLQFIKENSVDEILLGLPIGLSGQETESTSKVRKFSEWLIAKTSVSVKLIDERFTTKEILRTEKDKELIDSLVAQKMLDTYLQKKHV